MALKTKRNTCPYCGSPLEKRRRKDVISDRNIAGDDCEILVCSRYPECDSYVSFYPEKTNGIPADGFSRFLRQRTHRIFNIIYKTGIKSRENAYELLNQELGKSGKYSHIRFADVYDCIDIILFSIEHLRKNCRRATSLKALSHSEYELFTKISELEIDLDNKDWAKEEMLEIIKLIYDRQDFKCFKISKRVGSCMFYYINQNGDVIKSNAQHYFFSRSGTLRESVYSLTKSMYNRYLSENGLPPLNN